MARVTGRAGAQTGGKRRRVRLWGSVTIAAFVLLVILVLSPQRAPTRQPVQGGASAAEATTAAGTEPAAAEDGSDEQLADASDGSAEQPPDANGGSEGGDDGMDQYRTGVFYETGGKDGQPVEKHELLIEPVPDDCHMEEHADYDGPALRWGLEHKVPSAAQCCQACKDLSTKQPDGSHCNVWVWCGSPTGECWSPDIWNHTTGECWLKYQEKWDGNTDLSATNLAVNRRGKYPQEFRDVHKTAPEMVAWSAGVIQNT